MVRLKFLKEGGPRVSLTASAAPSSGGKTAQAQIVDACQVSYSWGKIGLRSPTRFSVRTGARTES